VDALHALMIGQEPDLTVLVDMEPNTGLARALARQGHEERFEAFGADLQHAMRAGFLDLAKEQPDRFVVVNGAGSIEDVAQAVFAAVMPHLP
jgi:dTMP kinase